MLQKLARYPKRRDGFTFHITLVNCFLSRSCISTLGLDFLLTPLSSIGLLFLYYLSFCPSVGGESSPYRAMVTSA